VLKDHFKSLYFPRKKAQLGVVSFGIDQTNWSINIWCYCGCYGSM